MVTKCINLLRNSICIPSNTVISGRRFGSTAMDVHHILYCHHILTNRNNNITIHSTCSPKYSYTPVPMPNHHIITAFHPYFIARRYTSSSKANMNYNNNNNITIYQAFDMLQLSHKKSFTQKELRDAYFTAAKLCHPDSSSSSIKQQHTRNKNNNDDDDDDDEGEENYKRNLAIKFHAITEAYELLQDQHDINHDGVKINHENENECYSYTSKTEEQHFREACREYLGVDAEIVEESKRCPLFREWLKGRTVDAFHWNNFLMLHGGLAPMLRKKKTMKLTQGDDDGKKRRRRKR
mmetsp:Transcript_27658/g.31682  ORF Transcript_27658/g.31682 Transcript_27658/m.31682 type:complete len:294 (-) Transcript_27658:95-976(-)